VIKLRWHGGLIMISDGTTPFITPPTIMCHDAKPIVA
jgi:hypothetical protein